MSPVQPLVIVGTPNANTLDVIDAIEEINKSCLTYQVLGYINPSGPVEAFTDYPYLGGLEKAHDMATEVKFCGLIGNRVDIIRQMALPLDRYQTIIHPNAYVSPRSTVGRGCFIGAGCTVGATAVIGDLVVMLQGVGLSHDNEIGAYCTLTCGVTFSGRVKLEESCFIGTNATIVLGARVGAGSVIGAGAVVRHDVPAGQVWVGNPARFLRAQTATSVLGDYTKLENEQ